MEMQWELMVFTLFICLGAGIFAVLGTLSLCGRGERLQIPALITSFAAIVLGGVGSFLHLQHWERIFNGFGHITSGITQELICIVILVVMLVVYFLMVRKYNEGQLPRWCGALAILVSLALVVVMAHSYNMDSRLAWNTPLLWLYYLSNAWFFGSLALAVIAGIKSDEATGFVAKLALIGGLVQVVATVVYAIFFTSISSSFTDIGYYYDSMHPTKDMASTETLFAGIFTGEHALLFWLGVIIVGLVVPIILAFLAYKKASGLAGAHEGEAGKALKITGAYTGIALVCALIGGMCFRTILYILGLSIFTFF